MDRTACTFALSQGPGIGLLWWPLVPPRHSVAGEKRKSTPPKNILEKSKSYWMLIVGQMTFKYCVMRWQVHMTHLCIRPSMRLVLRKSFGTFISDASWTRGLFSKNIIFTWKDGWQINYGYSYGCLAGIFSKSNEASLSLQETTDRFPPLPHNGKKIPPLPHNGKNQVSKLQWAFWKPCVCRNKF